jgi:hypothetical protein
VPPGTPDDVASAVLRTAGAQDYTATVEDLLTGDGVSNAGRSDRRAANPDTPRRA